MKKLVLKHALVNAVQHGGKALVDAVLRRVLSEQPELKKDVKTLLREVEGVVKEILSLIHI